jgi:dethiobiotin synthetase
MAACAIAFAFRVRAMRVGVMKPIATGCAARTDLPALASHDAESLLAAAGSNLPLELVSPYRYRAALGPLDAAKSDGAPPPDFAALSHALAEIESTSDVVLVEDACGPDDPCALAARIDDAHDFADLALALRLELILVVVSRTGFIESASHAITEAARRAVPMRGAILNALNPIASATVADDASRLAAATGVRILGTVRYKEPLSLAIIEQLL